MLSLSPLRTLPTPHPGEDAFADLLKVVSDPAAYAAKLQLNSRWRIQGDWPKLFRIPFDPARKGLQRRGVRR